MLSRHRGDVSAHLIISPSQIRGSQRGDRADKVSQLVYNRYSVYVDLYVYIGYILYAYCQYVTHVW